MPPTDPARATILARLAPSDRYATSVGEGLLCQLMGVGGVPVEGVRDPVPGRIHVLLVGDGWRSDVSTVISRMVAADPTRSRLYTGERDVDALLLRRSEGWRFRRRVRNILQTESVLVEGGLVVSDASDLDDEHGEYVRALLTDRAQSVGGSWMGLSGVATAASALGVVRCDLGTRGKMAKPLRSASVCGGMLREFDLVVPLSAPESRAAPVSPIARWQEHDEDELASEHARAWVRARREGVAPRVSAKVRATLETGLRAVVAKHRKWGGAEARRIYGVRAERTLVRLASASARARGRPAADTADARRALALLDASWRTVSELEGLVSPFG